MRVFGTILLSGLVAACQTQAPVPASIEREMVVAGDLDQTLAQTDQVLTDLGFERQANGVPRADFDGDIGWAVCEEVKILQSTSNRNRRNTDEGYVDLVVFVLPADTGGSRVMLQPRFVGLYPRPDSPDTFEFDCATTGALERAFFQRLRALDAGTS